MSIKRALAFNDFSAHNAAMQHAQQQSQNSAISTITLDDSFLKRRSSEIEHERRVAMDDLVATADFSVLSGLAAPYQLKISIREGRLSLHITDNAGKEEDILIPLAPMRGVIKDYFLMCESYYAAIPDASSERIQTLDMARRSVHNEGAELLTQLLQGKVALNFTTARRLFTLICVLHIK